MSAEYERDEPQFADRDFDAAAEALFAQTDAPDDAPAEGEEAPRQTVEAAPAEAQPPADESDDDDEALDWERRFARAQRREEKARAREAELAAERQRALDQVNGYQGRLKQEQARAKALETERDQFKQRAEGANAAYYKLWEDAIAQSTDPAERAGLEREYRLQRAEREMATERAQTDFEKQQREQEASRQKAEGLETGIRGMREHAMPDLIEKIEAVAEGIGVPAKEIAHIANHLRSEPIMLAIRHMPPEEIEPYRVTMFQRALQELSRVRESYQERQAAQNRQEAAPNYRGERPVGAGGGNGRFRDVKEYIDAGDYDGTADAVFANFEAESQGYRR